MSTATQKYGTDGGDLKGIRFQSNREKNFSSPRMWQCISHDETLSGAEQGAIFVSAPRQGFNFRQDNVFLCSLTLLIKPSRTSRPLTPQLQIYKMVVNCESLAVTITTFHRETFGCEHVKRLHIVHLDNRLTLGFQYNPLVVNSDTVDIYIKYKQVSNTYGLKQKTISEKIGYVETTCWGRGFTCLYGKVIGTFVKVRAGHTVMISFPRSPLDSTLFCNEHVHIHLTFIIHKGKRLVVLDSCSKQWHPPFIMRADIIRVKYTGWTYSPHYGRLGFRMLYSFHKHSAVLLQQPGHVWNCSVPHWADFQQHFPCNLMADCSGEEDEAVCPYAGKPHCSEGEISVGDTCYEYVIPDEPLTWQEAAEQCRLRDAHLANLVTPSEWNKIMNILQVIDLSDIYIALQSADLSFPEMYKAMLQWSSKSISFYYAVNITTRKPFCTYRSRTLFWPREDFTSLATTACNQPRQANFLCERHLKANRTVLTTSPQLATPTEHFTDHHHRFIHCPRGHLTQSFLACDVHTDCWHHDVTAMTCQAPLTPLPPTFQCSNNLELVPYSLLCDSRSDCSDESDEDFCVFPPCVGAMVFDCGNGQCIPQHQRCDQLSQCLNEADEREQECTSFGLNTGIHATTSVWPPAAVHFNGRGNVTLISLQSGDTINHACPETHFACPGMEYYCMPVYVRCNDVNDCPGFEDETDCDSYTCSGYYRCRKSMICVHPEHICDGIFHCPQRDDEILCQFSCPAFCTCYGLSIFCHHTFMTENITDPRYLDARKSGVSPSALLNMTMLVYLSLQDCHLVYLSKIGFPNLLTLDLSHNNLAYVDFSHLKGAAQLQSLSFAHNPMTSGFQNCQKCILRSIKHLDFSHIPMNVLEEDLFQIFPSLHHLNLSTNKINDIQRPFHLTTLQTVDLRGNPIKVFPQNVFQSLTSLQAVYADNYKLCCSANLPAEFNVFNCHAPSDEISSCESLLQSNIYRVFLSVFAILILVGNMSSFVFRAFVDRTGSTQSYGIFVIHLCVSDFLMGLYLALIGVADRVYQGTYLWNDITWRNSFVCTLAGWLSLMSNEVSAFNICLITLDRFLVLRFPFRHVHFGRRSAHVACIIAWISGTMLASTPALPIMSHWQFYSMKSICIPLPVTRNDSPGHFYSFSIIVCLNFVLFLMIATGQAFIYWSVRVNSMSTGQSNKTSSDFTIARRLISVALSDFFCWFPIGLLGFLAASGFPIPGEVNVTIAMLVLPLNSAINPFLYTLNIVLEKRRQARDERSKKLFLTEVNAKVTEVTRDKVNLNYSKAEACKLVSMWMKSGLIHIQDDMGINT